MHMTTANLLSLTNSASLNKCDKVQVMHFLGDVFYAVAVVVASDLQRMRVSSFIRVVSIVGQLTIHMCLQSLKSHRKTTRSWLLSPEQGKVLVSYLVSTSLQRRRKTRRHTIPSPQPPPANRLMRHRQVSAPNKLASCDLGRLHF